MKLLTGTLKFFIVASVAMSLGGCLTASNNLKSQPGYADLSLPDHSQVSSTVSLSLEAIGLIPVRWLVKQAVENSDEAGEEARRLTRAVLQAIKGIQLRVYEVNNNAQLFDTAIDKSVATLKQAGWKTLVTVNETDERVVIMQAGEDEVIVGLSVLVSNPEEAVFVNVVGELKPADLVQLAENVPAQ